MQTIERILQKHGIHPATTAVADQAKQQWHKEASHEKSYTQKDQHEDISKMFKQVLQPEAMQEQLNPQFMQKRKRKKKQSRHL